MHIIHAYKLEKLTGFTSHRHFTFRKKTTYSNTHHCLTAKYTAVPFKMYFWHRVVVRFHIKKALKETKRATNVGTVLQCELLLHRLVHDKLPEVNHITWCRQLVLCTMSPPSCRGLGAPPRLSCHIAEFVLRADPPLIVKQFTHSVDLKGKR